MSDLFNKCENNISQFDTSIKVESQAIIDEMSSEMIERSRRGYQKIGYHTPDLHPTLIKIVNRYFRLEGFKCEHKKNHFLLSLPRR